MPRSPERGEIYRLKSDLVGKPRPILIVSLTRLNGGSTCIAVPFTSQQVDIRLSKGNAVLFEVGECGLPERCVAKVDCVTLTDLSNMRLLEGPLGIASEDKMRELERKLARVLGIQFDPKVYDVT